MILLKKRIRLVSLVAASTALACFVACNGASTEGSAQDTVAQTSQGGAEPSLAQGGAEPSLAQGGAAQGFRDAGPGGGVKGQLDPDAACADELADALHALDQASTCDTSDDCELVSTLSWQLSEKSIGMDNGEVLLNKNAYQQSVIEAAAVLSTCGGNLGPSGAAWVGTVVCEDHHCTAGSPD